MRQLTKVIRMKRSELTFLAQTATQADCCIQSAIYNTYPWSSLILRPLPPPYLVTSSMQIRKEKT